MTRINRRETLQAVGAGLFVMSMGAFPAAAARKAIPMAPSWVVFYGADAESASFSGFRLVVLDPSYQRSIIPIRQSGAMVLGYASLGELDTNGPFRQHLPDSSVLLEENGHWPGSFLVDVRSKAWRTFVLETIIPSVLRRGFDGLFLDTMDSVAHLDVRQPGMIDAGAELVHAIRKAYPEMPIMMNRGYGVLPHVCDVLDAVLAESMLTTYDFSTGLHRWMTQSEIDWQLAMLAPARNARRAVAIYSLDYWDPSDQATIRDIYAKERALGHRPYVATIKLDQIVKEPLA